MNTTPPDPVLVNYLRATTLTSICLAPILFTIGVLFFRRLRPKWVYSNDLYPLAFLLGGILLCTTGAVLFLNNIEPLIRAWFFPGMPCPQ